MRPHFFRFLVSLLVVASAAFASFVAPLHADEAKPPLIVGMEMAYPPFEMTDPAGKPAGVSVDLAEALGAALRRPVKFENIPYPGLIPALKTGKIDCIISSMTATKERSRTVAFSDPYLQTGLCLLVSKDAPIHSITDVNAPGRSVAVKIGTTGHLYATRHLGKARVLVLDKESECVLEVTQGKADCFIYDQMSVFTHWQKNPRTTRALLAPFQQEGWAVALRKGDDLLLEEVNRFITDFRKEGGFEKLGDKWLPKQKSAFREQNIPFVF